VEDLLPLDAVRQTVLELVRQEGRDRFAEHGSGVVRGLEQGRDVQGQGHAQLGCVVLQFGEITAPDAEVEVKRLP